MNKITIIGNLTKDPDVRTTTGGDEVTTFTVAVNRRTQSDHPEADFFRVSAWRQLGEICAKYLAKGEKVAVLGSVRANAYTDAHGNPRASMEVTAQEVYFLSPRGQADDAPQQPDPDAMTPVVDEDLPF